MTVTLDLPRDLADALTDEATRLNLSLPEYLRQLMRERTSAAPALRNGAELVEYWRREGLLGSRADITDPESYARALRASGERRKASTTL